MVENSWPVLLSSLLAGEDLTKAQAFWALDSIMNDQATAAQIGAFMLALRAKGESVQELSGLVDAMLQNALPLNISNDALDIVGTGGDLIGTVNISTMASIVAAATGIPVLKHGSRSASGKTGSSQMLEELGVRLDLSPEKIAEVFQKTGITFFFAPVFHPAMKYVAPIRRELGIPTTFNFLGPLANPAQPIATALGVSNQEIAPLMAMELANRGRTGLVFSSLDGLDEISITAPTKIWQVVGGEITESTSSVFVDKAVSLEQLLGGDAKENAEIARELFSGNLSGNFAAIKKVVLANAAAGIVAYELAKNPEASTIDLDLRLENAFTLATAALEDGRANDLLGRWIVATS